ncbi:MAG TPA: hypothetical protein VD763_10920 [Candidatus Saccharimonadales bacterium]|nr:hypothetical protein [Candidatus Saccharimonadales bacterium]
MTTIDCPWCTGQLSTDEGLTAVSCTDCGVTVEVAPDPIAATLDLAA